MIVELNILLKTALLLFVVLAITQTAVAQEIQSHENNLYLSVFGGRNFPANQSFEAETSLEGAVVTGQLPDPNTGHFIVGGAIGYELPLSLLDTFFVRSEIEVSYLEQETVVFYPGLFGPIESREPQSQLFLYLNNVVDIRWHNDQRIVPYVGFGLGLAKVRGRNFFPPPFGLAIEEPVFDLVSVRFFSNPYDDLAFASNLTAGLQVSVSKNIGFFAETRYYWIRDIDLAGDLPTRRAGSSLTLKGNAQGVTAAGGLRFRF